MQKETKMVRALYSRMVDREWNRLVRDDFHRLEYDTTWRFLKEHLPKTGLVLDAGGGPGRYTIELARQGYDVVLLDLVAGNLERAREEIASAGVGVHVKGIVEGTITDLSAFADNSFDAVLCLGGPLSHVYPESERVKAVSELVRVARQGAPVFVSVISKYGLLLATPEGWPQAVADRREDIPGLIDTGDSYAFIGDGYCHFFTSAELERAFARENVEFIRKVGLEGFNTDEETTNEFAVIYPEAWKEWRRLHDVLCTDPFVVDASGHILIIVRKTQKSAQLRVKNSHEGDTRIEDRKLVGLLADEGRLRTVAAITLGAKKLDEIGTVTGLDDATIARALARLEAGGLIEGKDNTGYRLRIEVFREAARRNRDQATGSTGLQNIIRNGRLPRARAARLKVLEELAALFEPGRRYPEAEVNSRLMVINPDYALLRRYLVDEGFMQRANETNPDGHAVMVYWRTDS